jgi:hypothetical protein
MFVRYSCGCVGFQAAGKAYVVKACDHTGDNDHYYGVYDRDMSDKTTSSLRALMCSSANKWSI